MGCCGQAGKRSVRKQVIERPSKQAKKKVVVQRIRKSATPAGGQQRRITVARQHIVPRQKCHQCGFPTMAVNIAGRERLQCSNPNCRIIIK